MIDFADADWEIFTTFLGGARKPDKTISPDGDPYLYRWHVTPEHGPANVYLHVQVASDPRIEKHDHPWDNTTVMLAGTYEEELDQDPEGRHPYSPNGFFGGRYKRKAGDMIFRKAEWSHRLILTSPYAMTLFTTGPKIRDWGYWFPDGWHHNKRHNVLVNGVAIFREDM